MTTLPLLARSRAEPTALAELARRRASHAAAPPGRPRPGRPPGAVAALGEQAFRAGQLSHHYFGRLVRDPARMTDLPAGRAGSGSPPSCCRRCSPRSGSSAATAAPPARRCGGCTTASLVESVLMGYPDRVTVCVSSQAGCGMALPVLRHRPGRAHPQPVHGRDRRPGRLVRRAWPPAASVPDCPPRLSHVVFMGMGEPLANYNRVLAAVRRLIAPAPEGLGLSQRHITVSTVGLVPAIERLAGEDLSVTLALSLHAPDDDLRDELVPVNQRWKVAEVLRVCVGLRSAHGSACLDRVRVDQGRQRPAVAGRPAGSAARRQARACEPHPAQSHPGLALGRQPEAGGAGVRPAGCAPPEYRLPYGIRADGRSTARAGSSPLRRYGPQLDSRELTRLGGRGRKAEQ